MPFLGHLSCPQVMRLSTRAQRGYETTIQLAGSSAEGWRFARNEARVEERPMTKSAVRHARGATKSPEFRGHPQIYEDRLGLSYSCSSCMPLKLLEIMTRLEMGCGCTLDMPYPRGWCHFSGRNLSPHLLQNCHQSLATAAWLPHV